MLARQPVIVQRTELEMARAGDYTGVLLTVAAG